MTNTLNTPVEALEYSFPFLVTEYSVRKGSGGKGKFFGGNGLVREIKLLSDAEVTVLSERRETCPYGLNGGEPGKTGENIVINSEGEKIRMPSKFSASLKKGEVLRIETPGGGGWGSL
jgi:N-methylhydantoinase B